MLDRVTHNKWMNQMSIIRVPVALSPEQHEALTKAGDSIGLKISPFMRMAAMKEALKMQQEAVKEN